MKLNIKKYKDEAQDLRAFITELIDQSAPESTIQDLCRHLSVMGTENLPESLGQELKQSIHNRGLWQDRSTTISPVIESFGNSSTSNSEATTSSSHGAGSSAASSVPYLDSHMDSPGTSPRTARSDAQSQDMRWQAEVKHNMDQIPKRSSREPSEIDEEKLKATQHIWEDRIAAQNQRRIYQKMQQDSRHDAEESRHLHIYSHQASHNTLDGLVNAPGGQVINYQIPIHSMQPLWTDCDSAFSQTIVHFISLARERIKQGWDLSKLLSSNKINLDMVLLAEAPAYDPTNVFDVDTWGLAVIRSFTNHMTPELKIAGFIKLTRTVSWLIAPSEATFAAIPAGCRPTPASRFYAHAPELSFACWPDLGDALILNQEETIDPSWTQTVMQCVRIDWPAPDAGVRMTYADPVTGATMLSAQGEAYITNQQNWVFDEAIRSIAPNLNLTKGRFGRPRGGSCPLLDGLRVPKEETV